MMSEKHLIYVIGYFKDNLDEKQQHSNAFNYFTWML